MVILMQRYFSEVKSENSFILSADDLYHIKTVMRMNDGDKLEVVSNKKLFICELSGNKVNIIEEITTVFSKNKEITLVLPLLKEAKMDIILQKATELGVDRVIPLIMERSIVKLNDEKEEKRIVRWNKICKEAAEQAKRLDIPVITGVKRINDLNNIRGLKFVCSTSERKANLRNYLNSKPDYDKITLVIGPEGGISSKEEDMLVNMGFDKVSLGNLIMRVETVPLFVLSILNYINME